MSDWYATGYVKCRRDRALQAHIVSELMAENAALWIFVRGYVDPFLDATDLEIAEIGWKELSDIPSGRDALRKYEVE